MARTTFIPLGSISSGPAPRRPAKPERSREELDRAMAECLAAMAAQLVHKRYRNRRRYGK